jgi:hypothetical protein
MEAVHFPDLTHQALRAWSPLSRAAGEELDARNRIALSRIAGEGAERSEAGLSGRIFRDVDGRQCMEAETDIMHLACLADRRGTRIVEAGECVIGSVELISM